MDRILQKNGWLFKHFKYTGNGSPVDFNGTVKCRYNAVFGVQEIDRVIAVTAL